MAKRGKREKQQTLEATLACLCNPGRLPVRPTKKSNSTKPVMTKGKSQRDLGSLASSSPAANTSSKGSSPVPPSSSLIYPSQVRSPQLFGVTKKRRIVMDDDSSDESNGEENVVETPGKKTKCVRKRQTLLSPAQDKESQESSDDDDEEEDSPLVASTARRKRPRARALDDSDDDDQPLVSSPIKRRRLVRRDATPGLAEKDANADDEDVDEDGEPVPSSMRRRRTGRKQLTDKQKARERLRRMRAGEVINEEEESSSSGEEPKKALYDSDSDHLALTEFEDDEEGVPEVKIADRKGKKRAKDKKTKPKATYDDADSDESMDEFIVDDSDVPLGIPDDLDIPLHLTHHSHKRLSEHFRDVIEWLVQFKINPGFSDKGHALYWMAWKKLDDEVCGLAQSKFISSSWKKDFYMALRARPYFTSEVLLQADVAQNCEACGRGGHPSTRIITLGGMPYFKNSARLDRLLEPIETSSTSDSDSESEDVDEDGMRIPNQTKQWRVGMVCASNAEMGHKLLHWKHDLLEWVDARLHEEGYMAASKLAERERMTPKKKHRLVDKILVDWGNKGTIKALYQDFKGMAEEARTRSTTGKYRR
ncbi:hypothetical protein C8A03DRAFT_11864 [Achaetomium macrosporum]|uniref:DUF4211 domain-containing protein n=1 Tax=Achaetomium macrosporum TaxID=79813 RepID=A0AAN7CGY7_9PEZI|nr:hypothetical protein C8A03DRAFT_11864 [Achaetomium macrosporum]